MNAGPDSTAARLPAAGLRAEGLSAARLIAVDWGTSRLRAWLVDAAGRSLATASSDQGIGSLSGGHEQVFEKLVASWPKLPAIMAGMVGSRQGWHEAAYLPCPATAADIGGQLKRFTATSGRAIAIVPGLAVPSESRDGDVIRGEETQLIGLVGREPGFTGAVVLPGTHSKWARLADGAIADFQTFMTGELFELLSEKSFLRHSVAAGSADLSELPDFSLAVRRTVTEGLPFLGALFSVRARQLLAGVSRENNLAYLSGLIIGGELAAARAMGALRGGAAIRIVAAPALVRAYSKALAIAGLAAQERDGSELALAGLMQLARAANLLDQTT
jgi:2-dehydro-3-deoxygalactonokinase